jgi:hypothetical protein
MNELMPHAELVAARLKARKETVAVAESSAGGLIAAALLAVPGASAYFIGGAVLYTRKSLLELLQLPEERLKGVRPASEPYALLKAQRDLPRTEAPDRQVIATAIPRAVRASLWRVRSSACAWSRRARKTAFRTCTRSPSRPSKCCTLPSTRNADFKAG